MGKPVQPERFTRLGAEATPSWATLGEPRVLDGRTLALLCSARCPGGPILRALDLARELRDADLTVVGGFHSPVEQDCLTLLLRGTARIVVCPAREVEGCILHALWVYARHLGAARGGVASPCARS